MNASPQTARSQPMHLHRLLWVRLVLLAVLSVAALLAPALIGLQFTRVPLTVVVAAMLALTFVGFWRARDKVTEWEIFAHLLADTAALSVTMYYTGGYMNPLISLLLLPLVSAAATLHARYTWALAGITVAAYTLLLDHFEPLQLAGGSANMFSLHLAGMWITFVVSALVVALFVQRMSASVRERDRALAQAREQMLRQQQVAALGALAAGAAHELGTPLSTMAVIARELELDILADARAADDARSGGETRTAGLREIYGVRGNDPREMTEARMRERREITDARTEDLRDINEARTKDLRDINEARIKDLRDINEARIKDLRALQLQIAACKSIVARLQSRAGAGERALLAFDNYVNELVEHWRLIRPGARCRIELRGEPPPPVLVADAALGQAVVNLLNNAADASSEPIVLEASWTPHAVAIAVKDRGPGVAHELLVKLGREPVTTKALGHAGLGLVLARTTVDHFGGELSLSNEPGSGLTARLSLPLAALQT